MCMLRRQKHELMKFQTRQNFDFLDLKTREACSMNS